jgi:hypothetical protein
MDDGEVWKMAWLNAPTVKDRCECKWEKVKEYEEREEDDMTTYALDS